MDTAMTRQMYKDLGIDGKIFDLGEQTARRLADRFAEIDRTAEYNQLKVVGAMQKCRASEACLYPTSGYGYNDVGRDTLEEIYAAVFHTEAALVRPQIACGTHALALALAGNLRPGDELLSPVGKPYDTLEEVIGIRPSKGSLAEYGVSYRQVELLPDGTFDYPAIRAAITGKTRMVEIQRSKGYLTRPTFSVQQIGELIAFIRQIKPDVICMVDNCYGEFVETIEPSDVGADLVVTGSHRRLHRRQKRVCGKRRLPSDRPRSGKRGGRKPGRQPALLSGSVPGSHSDGRSLKGRCICRQSL